MVDAKIPQLSGLYSSDLQESINEEFLTVTDDLLTKFQKSSGETGELSEFSVKTSEHYNKNGIFSMVTDYEYFARSKNKNCYRLSKNIDTLNCVELDFSDLFADASYIDVINSMIEDIVASNPDKYQDLWAKPKLSQNQRFYIDDDDIVIFYPPYELSYYERGFVEIPLPLDELSGYLTPSYREILVK